MKIKINNIFKNVQNIKGINKNSTVSRRNNKPVLEDNNICDDLNKEEIVESINNNVTGDIEEIVIDNIDNLEPKLRRRKVVIEEINSNKKKPKGIKIYLGNLLRNKNNLTKGYYVLFLAMLGLGGGSVYLAAKTYNLFNKEDYTIYETAQSAIQDTPVFNNSDKSEEDSGIKEQDSTASNIDTKVDTTSSNNSKTTQTTKNNTTNGTKKQEVATVVPLSFSKPLNGEILKIYSIDKVIYSKTLELWKTHDGIDIKGNIGDKVKSIEKGIVEKVYEDSFYGVTVVIDHGQGYKSSYSNLDSDVNVKVKETVTKGKVIGKISNTAIGEIKDDPHLHFTLIKDNQIVDPSYIFN